MPAGLIALAVAHLAIFRHNGSAGPPTDKELKKLPQGRFWPNQMFMDSVAAIAVFAIIVGLAIFSPPTLDDKANPSAQFTPFPAWYFLALYGLLRVVAILPHDIAPIANLLATVVIPGALVTVLILLPFLDRNPSRRITKRPWVMGITAVSVIGAVGLSIFSQIAIMQEEAQAGPKPAAAATLPAGGSSAAAAGKGASIYAANCSSCHGATGQGMPGAFPPLAKNGYVTGDPKQVVHTVLYGLSTPIEVNGQKYNGQMPAWKGTLSNADVAEVVTYIRGAWGNSAGKVTEKDVSAIQK
jgi:mono/diheme cytochrome c family protein